MYKQYYCTCSEQLCRGISVGVVIQVQGRRGHICVGATGTNPLGTGEAEGPRPADTRMPVSPAGRELGMVCGCSSLPRDLF